MKVEFQALRGDCVVVSQVAPSSHEMKFDVQKIGENMILDSSYGFETRIYVVMYTVSCIFSYLCNGLI